MKEIRLNIQELITKLEVILRKGFSQDMLAGNYMAVYKGKGLEFVGFREYSPNDDAMMIDWKASLRTHKPMVKVMQEERNLTVFFLMDVSDKMLLSSHEKLKCEFAAELVATLSYAVHGVGDNVGLALFTDKVVTFIPPGIGRNQFFRILKTLKNPAYYGGSFDLGAALSYLFKLNILKPQTVVFIVSDFIGLKPGWEYAMKIAGLKFDLNAVVVRDPIDNHLPEIPGNVLFGDVMSDRKMIANPHEAQQIYEHEAHAQIERLREELNKTRSSMIALETDKPFIHDIFTFFKFRQRYK
ncbi:MAG: DUF58 domain-containing protein [Nanoarchaeota archaeon]|nr:DUF58 domain-containing protein [Nanoarchaeota archaeon]